MIKASLLTLLLSAVPIHCAGESDPGASIHRAAETAVIPNLSPPTRLDLVMTNDGVPNMVDRCDDYGGELIGYVGSDPSIVVVYVCENVDY
jgi:hypothetical protein